jgi:hypothetical protein
MESPIEFTLERLRKLDTQLAKGQITQQEMEDERLVVLIDLIIAKTK